MGKLKTKSELNILAAELLMDPHSYYASSVHCSYYGVFQYISSTLNRIGITYEQVSQDIRDSRRTGVRPKNSHEYPIELIVNEIEKKSDVFIATELNDKITQLKVFRKCSDYLNEHIDDTKGREAQRLSVEIIRLIKSKL